MITVSTSTIKGTSDVFEIIDMYKGLDIECIELGAMHSHIPDLSSLYSFKRDSGMEFIVHCFFPPSKEPLMVNIAASDGPLLVRSFDQIARSLEFCRKADAKLYTLHPGYINRKDPDDNPEKGFDRFIRNYARAKEMCNDAGIPLAIENNAKEHGQFFAEPENIARALKVFPKMKLLTDIGHLKLASIHYGFDAKNFIERFQANVAELHIHKNDGKDDLHLPIDNDEILSLFDKSVLSKAFLTLEGQKNWSIDQIRDSIAFLRQLI